MRLVTIAIILALGVHLYGFAKDNSARFPETRRFAREIALRIMGTYEKGLNSGLETIERNLSRTDTPSPDADRKIPARHRESRAAVEAGTPSVVDDETFMQRRDALMEDLANVSDMLDQGY